ncbi:MAG: cytochrome c maturation protein CcmE [Proteobacteria bacterium]|nr:cytochrome c maturation protein CcmE [Pseudomonadota bacterium]
MGTRNLKYVVGGILVVGIIIGIFASISSENLTYYYTPDEVLDQSETLASKKIRVMGLVEKGSVEWIPAKTRLTFRISENSKDYVRVEYHGAKPDMFREGQGVVVEGVATAPGFFSASALLVKHNEEYKVRDHSEQKDDYYKSLAP